MAVRVLIVDDDARFRELARTLLRARGYAVVDEAADGATAIEAAHRVHADAALIDVQLPDTDGVALARALTERDNGLRVVLTSTDETLVTAAALAECGALAFIPKHELAAGDIAGWFGR